MIISGYFHQGYGGNKREASLCNPLYVILCTLFRCCRSVLHCEHYVTNVGGNRTFVTKLRTDCRQASFVSMRDHVITLFQVFGTTCLLITNYFRIQGSILAVPIPPGEPPGLILLSVPLPSGKPRSQTSCGNLPLGQTLGTKSVRVNTFIIV